MKKVILLSFILLVLVVTLRAQEKIEVPLKLTTMTKYLSLGEHTITNSNFFNDLSNYLCASINFNEGAEKYPKNNAIKEYLDLSNQFVNEFKASAQQNIILLDTKDKARQPLYHKFFIYFGAPLNNDFTIKELNNDMLYVKRRLLLSAMGYNVYEISGSLAKQAVPIDSAPDIFLLPGRIKNISGAIFWGVLLNNKKFMLYQCGLSIMDKDTVDFIEKDTNFFKVLSEAETINFYLISDVVRTQNGNLHYPGGTEFRNFWLSGVGAANDASFLRRLIDSYNKKWRYLFRVLSYLDDKTIQKILDTTPQLKEKIIQWSPAQSYEKKIDSGLIVKDDIFDLLWVVFVMDEGKYTDLADTIIQQGFIKSTGTKLNLFTVIALSSLGKESEFKDTTISQFLHIYALYKTHNFAVTAENIETLKDLCINYPNSVHYLQDINFNDPQIVPAMHGMVTALEKSESSHYTITMRMFQSNLEFLTLLSRNGLASAEKLTQLMNQLCNTRTKYYQEHFLGWLFNELIPFLSASAFINKPCIINDPLMCLMQSHTGSGEIEFDSVQYQYQPGAQRAGAVQNIRNLQNLFSIQEITELRNAIYLFSTSLNKKKIDSAQTSLMQINQIMDAYHPFELPAGISPDYNNSFYSKKELENFRHNSNQLSKIKDNDFYKKAQKLLPDLHEFLYQIASEAMMGYVYLGAVNYTDSLFYYEKNFMRAHQFSYDTTIATLSPFTCGSWMNSYSSTSSVIGIHFVNSLYGIKLLLPGKEAQALVFTSGSHVLYENIYAMPFASLINADWLNYSEIPLAHKVFELFASICQKAQTNKELKNILLQESFYIIGNQRTALLKNALLSSEDINTFISPSDKLFIMKRLSALGGEVKEPLFDGIQPLLNERSLNFLSFHVNHSLVNSFQLYPSYETMALIDGAYLSERLIDTKLVLMYQMEQMNLSPILVYALLAKAERMLYTSLHQANYYDWKAYLFSTKLINEEQITQWIEELKMEGTLLVK